METNDVLSDAVHWSEGMLLSPQHLQQNDIYWHGQLRQRLNLLNPHCYGVSRIAVDSNQLNSGIVAVTDLECVLPEGLLISFPGTFVSRTLSIDVNKWCKADGKPVRIHIGVPPRSGSQAVATSSIRRYDVLPGRPTPDENTGIGDVVVERMQLHIELYVAETLPADYSYCPLMDVVRDAQGHFKLAPYHPPMLRMAASAFLGDYGLLSNARALAGQLWEKLRSLAGEGHENGYAQTDEEHHASIARHLAMSLPQLDITVGSDDTAPEMLYRSLAQVVGHVASLGSNPVPPSLTPYNHDDCVTQFGVAIDYIKRKLELINTIYDCFPFALVSDEYFAQRLPVDVRNELIVELRPRVGESVSDLTRWLKEASIASDDLMPTLRQRRLHGAISRLLTPEEIAEQGLRPNGAYYEIRNQRIEVGDKGVVHMFRAGRSLLICGAVNSHMPAAILLYQRKAKAATGKPAVGKGKSVSDKAEIVHA